MRGRSCKTAVKNQNMFTLIGGVLIIVSLFAPFFTFSDLSGTHAGEHVRVTGFVTLVDGTSMSIGFAEGFVFGLGIANILRVITSIGWLAFVGSVLTILFVFEFHNGIVLTSFITGICGFLYLLRFLFTYLMFKGSPFSFALDIGFFLLVSGVICMLISAGRGYFDRKALTT